MFGIVYQIVWSSSLIWMSHIHINVINESLTLAKTRWNLLLGFALNIKPSQKVKIFLKNI